jgi:UPF0176 protein
MTTDYQILLFYKFINLEDPNSLAVQQRAWCDELQLKGRTIIAREGINSTLEGTVENTEEFIKRMMSKAEFNDIHWKRSHGTGSAFPKLQIRVRDEIVTTMLDENEEIGPHNNLTGKYISPEELHSWIHSDKKFYIVDMRNDYEQEIGHFKGSVLPKELENFRDLPKVLPLIENLKKETIVTVCTGGIRCEKASGFLIKHGFNEVYQLNGGIVSYMEKYPNQDFLGKLYVFDGRVAMGFNTSSPEHQIVGKCRLCSKQSENVIDYYQPGLMNRKHGIVCYECIQKNLVTPD